MKKELTMGGNIRLARRASGMSGAFVADKLHISAAAYRRYERDETTPPSTVVLKLADLYGISADAVMRGDDKGATAPRPSPQSPARPSTRPLVVDLAPGQVLRIEINASVWPGSSGDERDD